MDYQNYVSQLEQIKIDARGAALREAAIECERIAHEVRKRNESQNIELGALRCRDAVRALIQM